MDKLLDMFAFHFQTMYKDQPRTLMLLSDLITCLHTNQYSEVAHKKQVTKNARFIVVRFIVPYS